MREQKESRALRQAMMVLVAAIYVALIASLLLGTRLLNIYVRKTTLSLVVLIIKFAAEILDLFFLILCTPLHGLRFCRQRRTN